MDIPQCETPFLGVPSSPRISLLGLVLKASPSQASTSDLLSVTPAWCPGIQPSHSVLCLVACLKSAWKLCQQRALWSLWGEGSPVLSTCSAELWACGRWDPGSLAGRLEALGGCFQLISPAFQGVGWGSLLHLHPAGFSATQWLQGAFSSEVPVQISTIKILP